MEMIERYRALKKSKPIPEWKISLRRFFYRLFALRAQARPSFYTRRRNRNFKNNSYDVLMVSNVLVPPRGGGTRSFLHLAKYLAKQGLRVAAISLGPIIKQFRYAGIDFRWVVHEDDLVPTMGKICYRRLLCQQDWAWLAGQHAEATGKPFWYFLRSGDDIAPYRANIFSAEEIARDIHDGERTEHTQQALHLISRAEQVIANSKFMADIVRFSCGRECSVIYPGIEEPRLWEKFRTPVSRAIVAMAGSTKKGIQIFLSLARNMPEEVFVLCGVKRLPTHVKERDLPPNVHWLGQVKAGAAYALAKLVLFPSQWAEPAGRVSPEAFLRGLPVLASRVGGIPEIVEEEQFLVSDFTDPVAWEFQLRKLLPNIRTRETSNKISRLARRYRELQQPSTDLKKLLGQKKVKNLR